jgi:hypothetical protein
VSEKIGGSPILTGYLNKRDIGLTGAEIAICKGDSPKQSPNIRAHTEMTKITTIMHAGTDSGEPGRKGILENP